MVRVESQLLETRQFSAEIPGSLFKPIIGMDFQDNNIRFLPEGKLHMIYG
jgi:hypothetical protein